METQAHAVLVIAIAAAAVLAGPKPADGAPAAVLGAAPIVSSAAPTPPNAPTAGSRIYTDAASCERATAALVAPAGTRFVCIPVEAAAGETARAH